MNPSKDQPVREYSDPNYPNVIWEVFEGPFKDDDGEEFWTFTGDNGEEGEGYIIDETAKIVDMVNTEYYGE